MKNTLGIDRYCKKCGAYIPSGFDRCIACGDIEGNPGAHKSDGSEIECKNCVHYSKGHAAEFCDANSFIVKNVLGDRCCYSFKKRIKEDVIDLTPLLHGDKDIKIGDIVLSARIISRDVIPLQSAGRDMNGRLYRGSISEKITIVGFEKRGEVK